MRKIKCAVISGGFVIKGNQISYIISRVGFLFRRSGGVRAIKRLFREVSDLVRWHFMRLFLRGRAKDGLVERSIHGNRMLLDLHDAGLSRELLLYGEREKRETDLVRSILKPGMTVLDIGANLGYYTLLASSLVGKEGRVFAIEPIPRNYEILKQNIELNACSNCQTYRMGISSRNGQEKMYLSNASNWHSMSSGDPAEQSEMRRKWMQGRVSEIIDVPIMTVDSFVEQEKIQDIHFMRMDIEGYEIEVIPGMEQTLRRVPGPCYVLFELHPMLFANPEEKYFPIVCKMLEWGFARQTVAMGDKLVELEGEEFRNLLNIRKNSSLMVLMKKG